MEHTRELDVSDLVLLKGTLGQLKVVVMFGYNNEMEEFVDIMKAFRVLQNLAEYVMEKIGKVEKTLISNNKTCTNFDRVESESYEKTNDVIETRPSKHINENALEGLDNEEEEKTDNYNESNQKDTDVQLLTPIVEREDLVQIESLGVVSNDESMANIKQETVEISVNPLIFENVSRDANGKSIYNCEQCNKGFVNLKRVRTHNCRRSKVTCSICLKDIGKKSMKKHIALHTNQETFTCQVCQKKFRSKSGFDGHMCKDYSDRECRVCDKSFKKPWSLLKHNKSVHEEKVIKERSQITTCKICDLDCRSALDVRKHMLFEHQDQAIRCKFCNNPFFTKKGLQKHMKEHVPISLVEIKLEDN